MRDSLQLPRLLCAVDPVGGGHCLTTVQAGFHLSAPRDEVLWLWGGRSADWHGCGSACLLACYIRPGPILCVLLWAVYLSGVPVYQSRPCILFRGVPCLALAFCIHSYASRPQRAFSQFACASLWVRRGVCCVELVAYPSGRMRASRLACGCGLIRVASIVGNVFVPHYFQSIKGCRG